MHSFSVTLRLDTPLLQSGPESRNVDPSRVLRGPSVRGLMRTWFRAVVADLVSGDENALRMAERLLLGVQGGEKLLGAVDDHGPTFRVALRQPRALSVGSFPIRPHDPTKMLARPGHPDGLNQSLVFGLRPHAFDRDPLIMRALWACVWLAFSFGSLGNRSRRGYGSLTITEAERVPFELAVFSEGSGQPDAFGLSLRSGFDSAVQELQQWLTQWRIPTRASAVPKSEFRAGASRIFVGARSWPTFQNDALRDLMKDLHTLRSAPGAGDLFGRASPRLASPLWVRYYKTAVGSVAGWIPIATYSGDVSADPVKSVLTGLGMADLSRTSGFRALNTF